MTPSNNFVFFPNGLPSLFAKRPEMNCPLPTKSAPLKEEWDTQSLLGVPLSILSFFDIDGRKFLIGCFPHGLCYYTLFVENIDKHTIARNTIWHYSGKSCIVYAAYILV